MLATLLGLGPLAFYPNNFALNFSAAHMDIVRVPHHELMNHDLIDSWSLEAWIYPLKEQKRPAAGTIVNIVGFPGRHPMLGMTYDGFAVAQLKDTTGKWYTYQGSTPLLKDGKWHHLAATWNGRSAHAADNKLSLYVDGQLEVAGGDLDDGSGQPKTPNTQGYTMASKCTPELCEEGMQIGGLYQQNTGGGYTGRFFSGTIDEVRVWTRELGKPEIVERMRKPLQAQDEQKLLFYFPFDDAGMDMASSEGSIVVFSKALDWPGMLGTSRGTNRPHWSVSNAPLTCTANSRAPACLLQLAGSAAGGSAWSKGRYSLFTMIVAMLATSALTSTLCAVLTHAVLTGRLVLPPGLSHLGAFFARVLPGSDYRRTGTTEGEHRGDWTWAQPQRKETPREAEPIVSTPSYQGSA